MATRTQQQKQYMAPGVHRPFTQEMRDRQARGKDPYYYSGSSISTNSAVGMGANEDEFQARLRIGQGLPRETFEEREKKELAMAVLDNPERLLMYAQAEGDSVAGQRLRFLRMMCPVEHEKTETAAHKAASAHASGSASGR